MGQFSPTVFALLKDPEVPGWMVRDAIMEEAGAVASVWIVTGECGEYSARQEWAVAAYLSEGEAGAAAESLNAWCRERGFHTDGEMVREYHLHSREKPELDPRFICDYTGTAYSVAELPLRAWG